MKRIKLAALLIAAVMTMSAAVPCTAYADEADSDLLIEQKIPDERFRETLTDAADDEMCRVVIEPPYSFTDEHINERYPTSIEESEYLNEEATKLFVQQAGLDESRIYAYRHGYVGVEIDLTKAEVFALVENPLIATIYGYTLTQWEQLQEQLETPDIWIDPSEPHEHKPSEFTDDQNYTFTHYYEGDSYIRKGEWDEIIVCRFCGTELDRKHFVDTYEVPEYNKKTVFGDGSDLTEEQMLLMIEKTDSGLLSENYGACGIACCSGSEMCNVWIHASYSYRNSVVREEMTKRTGMFFEHDRDFSVVPTDEDVAEEAKNWSAEDDAKMQKALSSDRYKEMTIYERARQKKADNYVEVLTQVKAALDDKAFAEYLGIAPEKIIETRIDGVQSEYCFLNSYPELIVHASLTRDEIIELLANDAVGYVSGETAAQKALREEYEKNSTDTDDVLDEDINAPVTPMLNISDATVFINGIEDKRDSESLEITEICADYTGKPIKLDIVVTNGERTLDEDIDYCVEYKNNVEPGMASLNIYGMGAYVGERNYHFLIMEVKDTAKRGDIDGDGIVTSGDALAILRKSVESEALSEAEIKLYDVDGDGIVTSNDALIALRISVGLIPKEL